VKNSEAFDELYEASRERLVAQIFVFTGDETESADLVQQAFERAWRHWSRVSSMEDPEAWVRLVAFNLAKNHRRWQRHMSSRGSVAQPEPDQIESEEGLLEFGDALRRLPPQQRQALVLHYVVGLPVRDVAEEMNAPPGTVVSWLHRGRESLTAALDQIESGYRRGNDD
jgi:RNA polymerase sigma-70 factor (ECF subfamily)